ncbi:FtsX-like permease family protein [Streptomyces sp. enrichment culture]|uniref:FtsX-like permease family protein n=1 Tax=Streptomyces sp. enrichment culture TaxID=1795815 RepID=UPI003F57A3FD
MAGLLFLRARAHRLLLAAALAAVLLTTTVLAGLAAFAGSVGDAGLRHALQHRDAVDAALFVTTQKAGLDPEAASREVRRGAEQSFDGLPVSLRRFDHSGPYALPRPAAPPQAGTARPGAPRAGAARGGAPRAGAGEPDLTELAAVHPREVRYTAGRRPGAVTAPGGVVEVAVPEAAARHLGLRPGPRVVTLTDRLGGPPVRVRVTGVYRPADATGAYWRLDRLTGGRGLRTDGAFTSYGPLVADATVFGPGRVARQETGWVATAAFATLRADGVDGLRDAARQSRDLIAARPLLGGDATVRTSLPEALDRLERSLLVARATLLIVSAQLALLAGYALLLVARLLTAERDGETRLLLARGASRRRIAGLAGAEALLLALPAAVCAPLLAGPLTRLLAERDPLGGIGMRLDAVPGPLVWLTGPAVALACAAAVTAPAFTAARAADRGRARALPGPLRAGADLALVALAAVAYWQLERRTADGGLLGGAGGGPPGVDPLLVAAPALALLAGAVLTLRLLPPAARIAGRRAAAGRGLTAPLAGWQLARRPARAAGPVLLLVLAVSMGMLAIAHGASWQRSQDDQAGFRAGADIRVTGGTTARFGQGGAYDGMPGLDRAVPAARTSMSLSGGRRATVLTLDTAPVQRRLPLRADLLADSDPVSRVMSLAPEDDERAGIALPPDTRRLHLDVALTRRGGEGPAAAPAATLTLTVEDRFGVPYRLPLGTVPYAEGPAPGARTVTADIDRAADAPDGRAAGPLRVTGVEVEERGFPERAASKRFTVLALRAEAGHGTTGPVTEAVAVPDGLAWDVTAAADPAPGNGERPPRVTAVASAARAPLDVAFHTGTAPFADTWGAQRAVTVRAALRRSAAPVPSALATPRFLESSGAAPGSLLEVPMPGGAVKVRITGVLDAVPTTGPDESRSAGGAAAGAREDGGALLVDLRAVNRVLAARPDAALQPGEWWLFTADGRTAEVAAAVRARAGTDPAGITVRDELAERLRDDPLGAGPQAALLGAAVAAALLAAVGFAVSTAGALRERSAEFAVLRALGARRRQPARLVALEQTLLIGLALVIGPLLGALLARAVIPLTVLTGQAARPVPEVLVELPFGQVLALLAGVAAAPALIVAAVALRRGDPLRALGTRGGE